MPVDRQVISFLAGLSKQAASSTRKVNRPAGGMAAGSVSGPARPPRPSNRQSPHRLGRRMA